MHWLKNIWCNISIQQDLTFHSLFASLFSRSVYQDDFIVNFMSHFVPLLLEAAVSLSFGQLSVFVGAFPEIVA